jgi:hypothetical protein
MKRDRGMGQDHPIFYSVCFDVNGIEIKNISLRDKLIPENLVDEFILC